MRSFSVSAGITKLILIPSRHALVLASLDPSIWGLVAPPTAAHNLCAHHTVGLEPLMTSVGTPTPCGTWRLFYTDSLWCAVICESLGDAIVSIFDIEAEKEMKSRREIVAGGCFENLAAW